MGFRCDQCGVAQPSHAKPIRVMIEARRTGQGQDGKGYEPVREGDFCSSCANRVNTTKPLAFVESQRRPSLSDVRPGEELSLTTSHY